MKVLGHSLCTTQSIYCLKFLLKLCRKSRANASSTLVHSAGPMGSLPSGQFQPPRGILDNNCTSQNLHCT